MAITFDVLDRFQENKVLQTEQIMNNIARLSKATITWCDLSPRFLCTDATLLCEFESDKI